jgi:WD40 repeat protein
LAAYKNKNVPVNSVSFSNKNEFLAAGLGDGIVKVWDLKLKDVARLYRSSVSSSSAVTSICFNSTN